VDAEHGPPVPGRLEVTEQRATRSDPGQATLRVRVVLRDREESEYIAGRLQDHGLAVRVAMPDEEVPATTGEIVINQAFVAGLIPTERQPESTVSPLPTGPTRPDGEARPSHDLDAVARRILASIHRAIERHRRGLAYLSPEDEQIVDDIRTHQGGGRRLRVAGREGVLVCLRISELARIRERLGTQAMWDLVEQVRAAVVTGLRLATPPTARTNGELLWVLPATPTTRVRKQFERLNAVLASQSFTVAVGDGTEHVRITPAAGLVSADRTEPVELIARVRAAAAAAATRLDLEPCTWEPSIGQASDDSRLHDRGSMAASGPTAGTPMRAGRPHQGRQQPRAEGRQEIAGWQRVRRGLASTPVQIVLSFALALGVPYLYYTTTAQLGIDVLGPAYAFIVLALVVTAVSIYVEGLLALDPVRPPAAPPTDPPPATLVIAAYLPNESATIVDTLDAFLRISYAGPLQVILAYNTPHTLPVEATLHAMARENPTLVILRVAASTSKAQNINAALEIATGQITGIFDADHHPAPDSVTRAWRWLAGDYDIVQGHCVIRNGGASWLSRLVAVEFESIYAVGHPGRAKLHGFGIFGGSNGYWRTDVLRHVRMRPRMLTEDIDSSVRALLAGIRIASDPALLSHELAPTLPKALTRQRLRWAQGWFQVSRKYFGAALASPTLNRRQKAGAAFLLGWRELYPWVSIQIFPLLAFLLLHPRPDRDVHWAMPYFLFLTLVTMGVGMVQSLFAYLLAHPDVRRHRRWFLVYALVAGFFYAEYRNTLARVAQLKEIAGDRQWRVTPRQAPTRGTAAGEEAA